MPSRAALLTWMGWRICVLIWKQRNWTLYIAGENSKWELEAVHPHKVKHKTVLWADVYGKLTWLTQCGPRQPELANMFMNSPTDYIPQRYYSRYSNHYLHGHVHSSTVHKKHNQSMGQGMNRPAKRMVCKQRNTIIYKRQYSTDTQLVGEPQKHSSHHCHAVCDSSYMKH